MLDNKYLGQFSWFVQVCTMYCPELSNRTCSFSKTEMNYDELF